MFIFLDANKSLFDFFIIFLSVKRICQHLNKPQKIAILKVQYYYLYFICCINSRVVRTTECCPVGLFKNDLRGGGRSRMIGGTIVPAKGREC